MKGFSKFFIIILSNWHNQCKYSRQNDSL